MIFRPADYVRAPRQAMKPQDKNILRNSQDFRRGYRSRQQGLFVDTDPDYNHSITSKSRLAGNAGEQIGIDPGYITPHKKMCAERKVRVIIRYLAKVLAPAMSGPFGVVKEQSSGLYANQMAERGFIALAVDPSYTGESGGEPHHVASPDINTEDFNAAVDFIGTQENVDRRLSTGKGAQGIYPNVGDITYYSLPGQHSYFLWRFQLLERTD